MRFDDRNGLQTTFLEKFTSRALFWRTICLLLMKFEIWSSLTFFRNFWPFMTFFDLDIKFTEKLSLRASFWHIVCILLMKFEIWLFWPLLRYFCVGWRNMIIKSEKFLIYVKFSFKWGVGWYSTVFFLFLRRRGL